ncbi:nicotinic acid mononucleotide adenylyltransferase [Candidatus Pantoea edessiphila]|uniref:Probable nicotinate-nucleotide adenylyltransferase n=1 Tax=Candidatus Pantoea edessiphila TaxID=2044610 RepID=A0A2P5T0G0_9GAMM|nr:nicotinate-nucleotide adenylyltransferase [Candidatus Pantoea edessiphila]PPI88043.1 nicotinic acid mononucleotide adenylyltransferase [Candidatus Pantoea edessiphila]
MSFELYAIFGGTFDPIHFGHLIPVKILANKIGLKSVTLLPNNMPPYRLQPKANAIQRLDMLKCAIEKEPLFKIDTRELQYQIPSLTVSTLENIRKEIGNDKSIAFIIGYDSFLNLTQWYRWQDLFSLCHLLVFNRDGYLLDRQKKQIFHFINKHIIHEVKYLYLKPSGYIWFANTPFFNISSTKIKLLLSQKKKCDNLLPLSVFNYINFHKLYNK